MIRSMNKQLQTSPGILHITTDINTAEHLDAALQDGVFLAWQDALYEGPIDAEVNLTHLSRRRAKYFVDAGWVGKEEIDARYQARNKLLFSYEKFEEVILWFDHDLNSQLQLVQIVEWFSKHNLKNTIISLVSINRLRGSSTYRSLNTMSEERIKALMNKRWEVTLGQMSICQHAWSALGSRNPNALLRFYNTNTSTMPHLKNAMLRFLKQYPSQLNGLSQTESIIANIVLNQPSDASDIFEIMQRKEGIAFMNRATFSNSLQNMCEGAMPLIEQHTIDVVTSEEDEDYLSEDADVEVQVKEHVEQKVVLKLTDLGRQVLHNWVDWIQVNGVNRWIGGVHLREGSLWRYDETRRKVVQTYV